MPGYVDVRAYAELNDFLSPAVRMTTVRRPFRSHQTVKDILEAMGIPHTEVDLIVVNGIPRDFGHRPSTGDRIAAYPVFEALDIGSIARLRPTPLRAPRFVIDVNLGRLARLLRLLGFDVWWSSSADDAELAEISLGQQRILLTRDRDLLKRRAVTHGLFVRSDQPEQQVIEVVTRLDLRRRLAPFTRCLRCNGRLVAVGKDEVLDRLEPLTRRYYDDFSRCADCGQIYWPGSHHRRMVALVDRLRSAMATTPE
ncbi:Mut7-C RNAse domain-containing protein [Mycolicibacterium thermoresistibile]